MLHQFFCNTQFKIVYNESIPTCTKRPISELSTAHNQYRDSRSGKRGDGDSRFNRADRVLCQAKKEGRNRVASQLGENS